MIPLVVLWVTPVYRYDRKIVPPSPSPHEHLPAGIAIALLALNFARDSAVSCCPSRRSPLISRILLCLPNTADLYFLVQRINIEMYLLNVLS